MSDKRRYDLYSPAFKANPQAVFARMRRDDPIYQQPGLDGETPIWFITGYDDAEAVLRDDKRFVRDWRNALTPEQRAEAPAMPPLVDLIDNHMLNKDGEDHRRLRALVNKAFTPRIINQMRGRIQAVADELLDAIEEHKEADLVEAYAFPLPIIVIAELLGVPAADRDKFRVWSDAVVTPDLSQGAQERFFQRMTEFIAYLRALFEERRRRPQNDLISALLQVEEAGDSLNEAELFSMVILLIVAGHETTVSLIGNAALALLQNPSQMARLKADPALIPTAVEEFLRYDGPVERALTRWAAEDVTMHGRLIRRGEPVIVILNAANHDPAQFDNPDALDLSRQINRHLAFGRGIHYCLGAPLARLEGEIALNTLLRRLPNLRLNVPLETLSWRPTPIFHGLTALPVTWDANV